MDALAINLNPGNTAAVSQAGGKKGKERKNLFWGHMPRLSYMLNKNEHAKAAMFDLHYEKAKLYFAKGDNRLVKKHAEIALEKYGIFENGNSNGQKSIEGIAGGNGNGREGGEGGNGVGREGVVGGNGNGQKNIESSINANGGNGRQENIEGIRKTAHLHEMLGDILLSKANWPILKSNYAKINGNGAKLDKQQPMDSRDNVQMWMAAENLEAHIEFRKSAENYALVDKGKEKEMGEKAETCKKNAANEMMAFERFEDELVEGVREIGVG